MSVKQDLTRCAYQAGGGFATRADRQKIVSQFADFLRAKNIQIKCVEHIKSKHITQYIESIRDSISTRTAQNRASALRVTLAQAGRHKLATQVDNRTLGIAGASRDGTPTAMTVHDYDRILAAVAAKDKGVAAVLALQRTLGLRREEGLQSHKSLGTWLRQLRDGKPIRVIYGTKGGRVRDTRPTDINEATKAIESAIAATKEGGGYLVPSANQKTALKRYSNVLTSAGAVGALRGHALRHMYAGERVEKYEAEGYTRAEALAQTSMDLGHGDGRGRYVGQVYLR